MSKNIESVAVLGGGFMGAGIAESASVAGLPVVIRELPEYLAAARTRLEKSMDSAVKRGSSTPPSAMKRWPESALPAS